MSTFIFLDENNKLTHSTNTTLNTPNIELSQGNITSDHGTINFNDEHLTTTGNITGNNIELSAGGITSASNTINLNKHIHVEGNASQITGLLTILPIPSPIVHHGDSILAFDTNMHYYLKRSSSSMWFGVNDNDRMVIDSSGNVGIGTNNPNFKLDINGTLGINGDLFLAGDRRINMDDSKSHIRAYQANNSSRLDLVGGGSSTSTGLRLVVDEGSTPVLECFSDRIEIKKELVIENNVLDLGDGSEDFYIRQRFNNSGGEEIHGTEIAGYGGGDGTLYSAVRIKATDGNNTNGRIVDFCSKKIDMFTDTWMNKNAINFYNSPDSNHQITHSFGVHPDGTDGTVDNTEMNGILIRAWGGGKPFFRLQDTTNNVNFNVLDAYKTKINIFRNLGIKNGHIVFGENPTVNSFDNIISFNNNKIISPIILSSQHTDLGIAQNISDTTHTSGEVYIQLRGTATYKYDNTAIESDNNLYYLALSTAAVGSWGVAFLKYTRQIYPTNDTVNIEFDVSWRGLNADGDSFYVYICSSTSHYNNDTQGLSIQYFTYNGATNYIEFRYDNGNSQRHDIPNSTTVSAYYQRFRILITQDGYIHLYKNNVAFVDRSNNPIVGNYSQIINDLSNINKQSIMFRNNNGGAWAEVRVKNITISNNNTYNSIVKDENNNLGIGTSSPLEKLHVNGSMKVEGNILMEGNNKFHIGGVNNNNPLASDDATFMIGGKHNDPGVVGTLFKLRDYNNEDSNQKVIRYISENENLGDDYYFNPYPQGSGGEHYFKGKIGLGTESPSEKLTLGGDNPCILFNGTWDIGNYYRIMGHNESKKIEFNYNDGTIIADNNAIILKTNNSERIKMNSAGDILIDVCRIGYVGHSNYAGFAHKDRSNSTDYCLLHESTGSTFINCASGRVIYFREHNDDRMVLKGGYLGIGTTSPGFPLHINAQGPVTSGSGIYYRYISNYNNMQFGGPTSAHYVSAKFEGRIWITDVIYNSSDNRIKTNIEDVPDNLALQQLRSIPCRYYEYIDKLDRGPDQTIGFIAQEVKSVFPMAVSQQKQIIPNVYKIINSTWTSNDNKFFMTSSDLLNVSGIRYKFYVSNETDGSDEKNIEIIGNNDNTFTFEKKYNVVFCYGSEVDDFNILDKNKLYTLNFSATQEIDKIQQQHITEIETLKSENIELKEKLSELTNKIKNATTFEDLKNSL